MARENITPLKPSYGVNDYGYINARIRAMRSNLLGRPELERMLQADNLETLESMLYNTEYGKDIKLAEQKLAKGMRRLDMMEIGLKQNFTRTMVKICSFLEGRPAELTSIILGHWDIYNLKAIIRGKFLDQAPTQITQSLFYVGSLGQDYLEKLVQKKDLNEVLDTIVHSHFQPMLPSRRKFDSYLSSNDLMGIELLLETTFYQNALEWCAHMGEEYQQTRDLLQAEIDVVNITTCLKLSQVDIGPAEALKFYIPDGTKIRKRDFSSLIAMSDVEKIISWLERMPKIRDGLLARVELFEKLDDISVFERFLETTMLSEMQSRAFHDPLGCNVLIGYLKVKYNELINLRIIVRAVEFGLPQDIVKLELIFV